MNILRRANYTNRAAENHKKSKVLPQAQPVTLFPTGYTHGNLLIQYPVDSKEQREFVVPLVSQNITSHENSIRKHDMRGLQFYKPLDRRQLKQ